MQPLIDQQRVDKLIDTATVMIDTANTLLELVSKPVTVVDSETTVDVASFTQPFEGYEVTRKACGADVVEWTCTCPSFEYQSGTDHRGYCKHIRAIEDRM